MNIKRILKDDRSAKAMTGLTKTEFMTLIPVFAEALYVERKLAKKDRKRKSGGGRIGVLKTIEHKLAAILIYTKCYPTFDVLGYLTDRERTRACRSTHFLLAVLERALGRQIVLPERKITSVEEFLEKFPDAKDVFFDGVERPVQKPVKQKRKKKLYSGKKKQTTRKTVIMGNEKKKILLVTKTKSGRRHDKRLFDKANLGRIIPKDVAAWVDTGFQGLGKDHDKTIMPVKATRGSPLTFAQKQNNAVISGIRIVVEHAIGGLKRFRAAADIYRNRIPNTDDRLTLVSAGLWNFHLQQTG